MCCNFKSIIINFLFIIYLQFLLFEIMVTRTLFLVNVFYLIFFDQIKSYCISFWRMTYTPITHCSRDGVLIPIEYGINVIVPYTPPQGPWRLDIPLAILATLIFSIRVLRFIACLHYRRIRKLFFLHNSFAILLNYYGL